MPLLAEMLTEAGTAWSDIAGLGVGIGPGNFTGIRISVATARGFALSLGIPAEGVGVAEALKDIEPEATYCLRAPGGLVTVIDPSQSEPVIFDPASDLPVHPAAGRRFIGPGASLLEGRSGVDTGPVPPIAPQIALIAAGRAAPGRPRPAPVYLRPADAAPPADSPPIVI